MSDIEDTVFSLVFVNVLSLPVNCTNRGSVLCCAYKSTVFFFVEVRSIKLFERTAIRSALYATKKRKGITSQRRKSRELSCRLHHKTKYLILILLTFLVHLPFEIYCIKHHVLK